MRLYLKIRENHPELYDAVRADGKVGVPVYVFPDGSMTLDTEKALDELRRLRNC